MGTKHDIETRADIEKLIIYFYKKVVVNPVISFIFTDVVKMEWPMHIQIIIDFLETILPDNPVYKKMRWKYIMTSIKKYY